MLCTATGYTATTNPDLTVSVAETPYKYFFNFVNLWWAGATLLAGVVLVLFGLGKSCFSRHFTKGIWFTGIGTFFAVVSLFWVAGYGDTPFYPSLLDPESSLTIRNASSSEFTLTAMSYVSIVIPFVLAYIAYVWHSMDKTKLTSRDGDYISQILRNIIRYGTPQGVSRIFHYPFSQIHLTNEKDRTVRL